MALTPGRSVVFFDEDGERHEAVVIDVFDRPGETHGPYANLVYNPGEESFGANTLSGLECDTSVPHALDADHREYSYTTETEAL